MKSKTTLQELEDAGWIEDIEYFDEPETKTKPPKVKPQKAVAKAKPVASPYVVVDNAEVIKEVSKSNELMSDALNNMVKSINGKPKGMKLKIKRDHLGTLDEVDVEFKY